MKFSKTTTVLSTIVIIISVAVLSACSKTAKPDDSAAQSVPVLTVSIAHPKSEKIPLIVTANGPIKAWQETIIGAEVGGLDISHVYVDVGDKVKKGQILAILNAAQVDADLKNQIANVAEAKANLEQAKVEAKQAISLEKVGAISSQELLQYTTKAKTTDAKLNAAIANLALQQLRLGYTEVKSPDDGIISSRSATVGSIVQTGSELFRLIRSGRLEWQAEISLDDISKIESGQAATIQSTTGQSITGLVRQTSPSLNNNTKNGIAFVDIPNTNSLKIGMNVPGEIFAGTSNGLVIPFKSIVSSDGYNYVMLVVKGNRIHKTKVTLGNVIESMVEVSSGLSSTDNVVVDGATFLNESDLVSISKINNDIPGNIENTGKGN